MCDIIQYYGYFLTIRDHIARDLTELTYKRFDLLKVYGSASTTSLALIKSNVQSSTAQGIDNANTNTQNAVVSNAISSTTLSSTSSSSASANTGADVTATSSGSSGKDRPAKDEDDDCTWLYAKNLRTNAYGYIGSDAIQPYENPVSEAENYEDKLIEDNNVIQQYLSDVLAKNQHNLQEKFFVAPVLCLHCRDYIWGTGKQGVQCEECLACFHTICGQLSDAHYCRLGFYEHVYPSMGGSSSTSFSSDVAGNANAVQNVLTLDQDMKIEDWSPHQVVEWMAALNMYAFAEVFKSKNIGGADLMQLDRDKLQNMGVRDEFHQNSILACISELKSGQPVYDVDQPASHTSAATSSSSSSPSSSTTQPGAATVPTKQIHEMTQYSFSKLKKCDQCQKYLRGIVHQGMLCKKCGIVAHRTCARLCIQSMHCSAGNADTSTSITPMHVRQSSGLSDAPGTADSTDPEPHIAIFGASLGNIFDAREHEAPDILQMCCNQIERHAQQHTDIDLYRLYQSNLTSSEMVMFLRTNFSGDLRAINLADYPLQCVVAVMKKFLRELPDPVIPVQFYDCFIQCSKLPNAEAIPSIVATMNKLPRPHKRTLSYLMKHLCQMCCLQYSRNKREPPTILVQAMCHLLIRPQWEKISSIVHNTEHHIRIIELILNHGGEWNATLPVFDLPPALPPRKNSRAAVAPNGMAVSISVTRPPTTSQNQLASAEWYWGNITKDEVKEKLQDCPDGTFLVRDASSHRGDYTLTLIKDGTAKLIQICHSNGLYGFTEPFTFHSVVDLISHYRTVSLKQYNHILDVKLLYPISRLKDNTNDDMSDASLGAIELDKLVQKFLDTHTEYMVKKREMDHLLDVYKRTENERDMKRQAQGAFVQAIKMFEQQMKLHEQYREQAQPHEIRHVKENYSVLLGRLEALRDAEKQLVVDLDKQKQLVLSLERDINRIKPEKTGLLKTKERFQFFLLRRGVKEYQIKQLMEDGYVAWQRKDIDVSAAHQNSNTWLMRSGGRQEAERLLMNMPAGTFLIRRRDAGHHALSITCNNAINHCLIYETDKGYGFALPYNIYDSLMSLVIHYAQNSLEEHNDALTTTLKYPVYSEYIQQYRQKHQPQQQQHQNPRRAQPLPATNSSKSINDASGQSFDDSIVNPNVTSDVSKDTMTTNPTVI